MENGQTIQKKIHVLGRRSNNYMSLKHMKSLIVLVVGLLAVGCKTIPVKELTLEQKQKALMDSVAGEYEQNILGTTHKHVYLDNGIFKWYLNDEKKRENMWSIVKGEIHIEWINGAINVWRINTGDRQEIWEKGSITEIARIDGGKRTELPKASQYTFKKIK